MNLFNRNIIEFKRFNLFFFFIINLNDLKLFDIKSKLFKAMFSFEFFSFFFEGGFFIKKNFGLKDSFFLKLYLYIILIITFFFIKSLFNKIIH